MNGIELLNDILKSCMSALICSPFIRKCHVVLDLIVFVQQPAWLYLIMLIILTKHQIDCL